MANTNIDVHRLQRIGKPALATVGIVLALAVLGVWMFGYVSGEEFSPESMTHRSYYYWEVPILGLQIWPVRRQEKQTELESYLTSKGLVARTGPPRRWDLVSSSRLGRWPWRTGDALIWDYYATAVNDDTDSQLDPVWIVWSRKHPDQARVFWPAVARLMRDNLYLLLPELFDLAEQEQTASAFQQSLGRLVAARYREQAAIERAAGNPSQAEQWQARAAEYESEPAR